MSLSIAAYRQAGDTIEDADIDEDAGIEISKLATRTLYVSIPAPALMRSGAGVASGAEGVYGTVTLPDANTGILYGFFPLPDEWDSGTITCRIWWNTPATANDVKFSIALKSTTVDGTTTAEETLTVTDTADATGDDINNATVSFAAADFTKGDFIGFSLTRDPSDVADTLGASAKIFAVDFEYTGRG